MWSAKESAALAIQGKGYEAERKCADGPGAEVHAHNVERVIQAEAVLEVSEEAQAAPGTKPRSIAATGLILAQEEFLHPPKRSEERAPEAAETAQDAGREW